MTIDIKKYVDVRSGANAGPAGETPTIYLTNNQVPGNAVVGDLVGLLFLSTGANGGEFTLQNTVNNSFEIVNNNRLIIGGGGRPAAGTYELIVEFGDISQPLNISVTSNELNNLTLSNAQYNRLAAPGTIIGAIIGKSSGSVLSIDNNDGYVALDGSENLIVGLVQAPPGTYNFGLVETSPGASNSPHTNPLALDVLSLPINTVLPLVTGTPAVGQLLTCSNGTWIGNPPSFSYAFQWLRDGVAIVGQTVNTYTVAIGDSGHAITCRVTATNTIGSTAATAAGVAIPQVWRGFGQGMRIAVQAFNGTSILGQGSRIRRKSKAPSRYVKIVTPLFSPQGTAFTASIAPGGPAAAVLTVTAWTGGTILPDNLVFGGTTAGTKVVAQLTNTNALGRPGREGTYSLNISQTVASRSMTGPIVDTFFDKKMTFQSSIELNPIDALSAIPVRTKIALWSGVDRFVYDPATWDFNVYHMESDAIDLGAIIPQDTTIGIWTYAELDVAAIGAIPSCINASSFIQRWEGNFNTASSLLSSNGAASRTSVSAVGVTQAGGGQLMCPAFLLLSVDAAFRAPLIVGDSIGFGSLEGQTGSGAFGDAEGTVDGVSGFCERGIVDISGFNVAANLSVGSDRAQYVAAGNILNSKGRMQLAVVANPTSVVVQDSHNDISSNTTTITYAVSTAYNQWDVLIYNGASAYLVLAAGTTSASAPTDTTGNPFVSGTATLRYIGAAGSGQVRLGATNLGTMIKLHKLIEATLPAVPRYQTLCTPDSADAGGLWAAAPGTQTANVNFGTAAASSRGVLNGYFIAHQVDLGLTGHIDPIQFLEYGGTNATSLWLAPDATARNLTFDGTHPNSHGMYNGAPAFSGFPG